MMADSKMLTAASVETRVFLDMASEPQPEIQDHLPGIEYAGGGSQCQDAEGVAVRAHSRLEAAGRIHGGIGAPKGTAIVGRKLGMVQQVGGIGGEFEIPALP